MWLVLMLLLIFTACFYLYNLSSFFVARTSFSYERPIFNSTQRLLLLFLLLTSSFHVTQLLPLVFFKLAPVQGSTTAACLRNYKLVLNLWFSSIEIQILIVYTTLFKLFI